MDREIGLRTLSLGHTAFTFTSRERTQQQQQNNNKDIISKLTFFFTIVSLTKDDKFVFGRTGNFLNEHAKRNAPESET